MAFSYTKTRKVGVGTTKQLKYEIFDVMGLTTWTLISGTWKLLDKVNNEQVLTATAGTVTVNNSDVNAAGATIKTLQSTVDFTDVPEGYYWLFMDIAVSGGFNVHMRALIRVKQMDEA